MRLERRLGYKTEERRLHARACRLRPQQTSLVWSLIWSSETLCDVFEQGCILQCEVLILGY